MMSQQSKSHPTPIRLHLRDRRFWIEAFIFFCIAFGSVVLPPPGSWIVRVLLVMVILEWLSFFGFHLAEWKKQLTVPSLAIQGFLGGLISSTTVFFRVCSSSKGTVASDLIILSFAMIAMLFECILIVRVIMQEQFWMVAKPLVIQGVTFILFSLVVFRWANPVKSVLVPSVLSDTPVVWRRVFRVSAMVFLVVIIAQNVRYWFSFSPEFPIFVAAWFEAHAVLTAMLSQTPQEPEQALRWTMIILFGNAFSKSVISLRSQHRMIRFGMPFLMFISAILAWIGIR